MSSSQSKAEAGSLAVSAEQPTQQSDGLADQTNYVPRSRIISIFLSCATTSFTTLLDETMIAVALPQISRELGGGSDIAWVATAYFVYVHATPSSHLGVVLTHSLISSQNEHVLPVGLRATLRYLVQENRSIRSNGHLLHRKSGCCLVHKFHRAVDF